MSSQNPLAAAEGHSRLVPLEACRGLAACVVLLHHFLSGFAPHLHGGLYEGIYPESLAGTLAFPLVNGTAAVSFFLVLSGYVLPYRYFHTGRTGMLERTAFKRFFRLAGPAVLSTFLVGLALAAGLGYFRPAAHLSGSDWLLHMANPSAAPSPSVPLALLDGLKAFFTGRSSYNSNLWTMRIEWFGSLLVYALAYGVARWPRRAGWVLLFGTFCVVGSPLYLSFPLGAALCWLHARRGARLGAGWALLFLAAAYYLYGYLVSQGPYQAFASLFPLPTPEHPRASLHSYFYLLASLLVMQALTGWKALYQMLDRPWGALLGRISFPLYLIHPLILFTWSSWLFVHLHGRVSDAAALGLTLLGTLPPLALAVAVMTWFDEFWLARVNRIFKARRRPH